jgi:ribose transport system substrate-binding protein
MRSFRIRPLLLALLAGVVVLALAACGGGDDGDSGATGTASGTSTAAAKADGGGTIGFSIPQGTDPGLQLIDAGMKAEASKLGMDVKTVDANLDVNKQLADLDSLVQQKVDSIVVWPLDSNAVQPALERAKDANIPVVAIYALADGPYYTDLMIDGKSVGAKGAQQLAETLGKGAKVAAIFGPPQVDQFREITEGFNDAAKAAGLDVVDTQVDSKISSQSSASLASDFKQKYGADLKGIFTSTESQARGVLSTKGGDFNPDIVTYANVQDTLDLIRDGKLGAGVYQNAVLVGRTGAWASSKAVAGEEIPPKIYFEHPVLTKENVGSFPSVEEQLTKEYDFTPTDQDGKPYLLPIK